EITIEQWYAGVIDSLVRSFKLYKTFDLETWWTNNHLLSPVQRWSKFIDTVLLVTIPENIVIFIDEIDSILSLKFNLDDFFAVIRDCYNCRADNPVYNRLTFALIGVSTPSDLIQDNRRTSFNIGRAIDLTGFVLHEMKPLAQGLAVVGNPQALIQAVLDLTGGQPFLTQKVCKLLVQASLEERTKGVREKQRYEDVSSIQRFEGEESQIPNSTFQIAEWVECLVRERIIENWEAQDEPEHLRTIRNRLLRRGEQRIGRLLGLCQQILQYGAIVADDSPEQTELRLAGLLVKQDGKLRFYNRIYQDVFNPEWCEKELAKLRPYAYAINAWVASGRQDESSLLRGQALQNAQNWTVDKNLTDLDYQFLNASQNLAKRDFEKRLEEAEEQAKQVLAAANRKAQQRIWIGGTVSLILLIIAAIA
ncbi:AAA-like domain-containing protein, partial [Nostoc sp.]